MELLKIGFVKKAHGLKGEIKVLPLTDSPERFKKVKSVFVGTETEYENRDVEHTIITPKEVIVKLKDCDNIEMAEKYRSKYIFIEKAKGVKLDEWEFYTQDLIGCRIFYQDRECGSVIDIVNCGANDNILISTIEGTEIYYPFLRDFIEKIDVKEKMIVINQIEDFFD